MTRNRIQLLVALLFLGGSLGLLGWQISRLRDRGAGSAGEAAAQAVMDEEVVRPSAASVAWTAPPEGVLAALAESPFLRPAGATARDARRAPSAVRAPVLTGLRTGAPSTVILNDRIVHEGESIAGWRVVSVDRDRVTLRSSDGKTIRLPAQSLGRP